MIHGVWSGRSRAVFNVFHAEVDLNLFPPSWGLIITHIFGWTQGLTLAPNSEGGCIQ